MLVAVRMMDYTKFWVVAALKSDFYFSTHWAFGERNAMR